MRGGKSQTMSIPVFHFGPLINTSATLGEVLTACKGSEHMDDKNGARPLDSPMDSPQILGHPRLAGSSMRESTLQFSATQPPNELFLSDDVRIFTCACGMYGTGWLRMTECAGLAVSDWENGI